MKIDVLIPHYNDLQGLTRSLVSVRKQNWDGGVRAIVADDGSDAETRVMLERLVKDCGLEVKLILNAENKGRPYTRNVLLQATDAPVVTWLDAGDEWYPAKLSVQAEALSRLPKVSMDKVWVTCSYDLVWPRGEPRTKVVRTDGDQLRSVLEGRLLGYLWTMMGTRDSFLNVGKFDAELPRLQDTDFVIRFLSGGGRIVNVDNEEPLCIYYKFDHGKSSRQVYACSQHILRKHSNIYRSFGTRFHSKVKFHYEILAARFAGNNGDRSNHRHHLFEALKLRPMRFCRFALRGRLPKLVSKL